MSGKPKNSWHFKNSFPALMSFMRTLTVEELRERNQPLADFIEQETGIKVDPAKILFSPIPESSEEPCFSYTVSVKGWEKDLNINFTQNKD